MGYDLWNHSKFLHHKVRNMVRRGWLKKTYNSGKLLTGRVQTGEKIENDELDILHPVGMVAHVEPGDKMEILTMDVGGDTSRRVISQVIGDREEHPQPDKNEVFFYAPNDKKVFTRYKKKSSGGGGGGGGGQRVLSRAMLDILRYGQLPDPFAGGGGQGGQKKQTKESGREPGMHSDADDQKISSTTKNSNRTNADDGIGQQTQKSMTIKAGQNTQFEASKHIRKGETHREGNTYQQGVVHAMDHVAGGGTSITGSAMSRASAPIGMPDMQDGSQQWQATGRPGQTSLLGVAGMLQGFMQQQGQKNQEQDNQIQDILRRLQNLGG